MADRTFTVEEIREFEQEVTAREVARSEQVGSSAGRALLARSRTVTAKDGGVITITDGDVLDDILAIEADREAPL